MYGRSQKAHTDHTTPSFPYFGGYTVAGCTTGSLPSLTGAQNSLEGGARSLYLVPNIPWPLMTTQLRVRRIA